MREQLDAANARLKQALENVYQNGPDLGLPAQPAEGASLTDVPVDLDETFSSGERLGELMQNAAQLGVVASSWDMTPKKWSRSFTVVVQAETSTRSTPRSPRLRRA